MFIFFFITFNQENCNTLQVKTLIHYSFSLVPEKNKYDLVVLQTNLNAFMKLSFHYR